MFKLLKWTMIGLVGVGATGYFVFGDNLFSYVSTAASSVRDSVRGEIPTEFEIKRAEGLVEEVDKQARQAQLELARADVRRDKLEGEIGGLEIKVAAKERKLKDGAVTLVGRNGEATYRLAGRDWTRERVELDLARTFDAYRQEQALLKAKRNAFQRQTALCEAARKRLDSVRTEQARLRDQIGALKARKAQVDAMQAASTTLPKLDTTPLGRAKKLLEQVEERLAVQEKILAAEEFYTHGIGGQPKAERDIGKEIAEYLEGSASDGGDLSNKLVPAERR